MGRKAGIESREDRVHGYIVRDDGLLLELKLLEDIGLEGRLGDYFVRACQQSIFFFGMASTGETEGRKHSRFL